MFRAAILLLLVKSMFLGTFVARAIYGRSRAKSLYQDSICLSYRNFHFDGRTRFSSFWIPTGGIVKKSAENRDDGKEDAHFLLIRAGYLRQRQPGVFHLLPIGLRVQEKIERLIDKHMQQIGAVKLSLSSFSAPTLWEKTGRLKTAAQDLFTFEDRFKNRLLLSPTHEEEITHLVASTVQSPKPLPLRLYQISRKYRDEARPRAGLLRGREFVMKDLYTFDIDDPSAKNTYELVRQAYNEIFENLKIPLLVAVASSGNMGGKISHEYHLPSPGGEDTLISCRGCGFVKNEEYIEDKEYSFVQLRPTQSEIMLENAFWEYNKCITESIDKDDYGFSLKHVEKGGVNNGDVTDKAASEDVVFWQGITKDRCGFVEAFYQAGVDAKGQRRQFNPRAVKAALAEVDLSVKDPLRAMTNVAPQKSPRSQGQGIKITKPGTVHYLFDRRIPASKIDRILTSRSRVANDLGLNCVQISSKDTDSPLDLTKPFHGDTCPVCHQEPLELVKAIELGHTFLLGTRYSDVLNAKIYHQPSKEESGFVSALRMGCHGIGVSRIIAAVAGHLSDESGLNWPRVIAPFECAVIPARGYEEAALHVYDAIREPIQAEYNSQIGIDVVLDDREKSLSWKLIDNKLIGVPIRVIVGEAWKDNKKVDVLFGHTVSGTQSKFVALDDLRSTVSDLLNQLEQKAV